MKRALWAAAALIAVPLLAQTPPLTLGDYAYDGAGNIKHIGNDVYVYDTVSRLLSGGAGPGRSQTYTYDSFGNITRIVTDGNTGAPRIPGVDPLTNRMSINTGGASTFGTYDAAGRMTAYTGPSTYSFAYDGADMVRELTSSAGREVYIYTADDERIAVASLDNAGAVSSWHWSLRGLDNRVLRQIDQTAGTWSWREDFIYGGDQLIAAELPAPTRTLHFFPDHLGTPRLITGNGGATIAKHTYYPFGEEVPPAPQDGQAMKFTGHERDFSGLDYMHARFYAAGAGRFASVDPIFGRVTQPRSWNRYSYAANAPNRYVDPTGMQIKISLGASGDDFPEKPQDGDRWSDSAWSHFFHDTFRLQIALASLDPYRRRSESSHTGESIRNLGSMMGQSFTAFGEGLFFGDMYGGRWADAGYYDPEQWHIAQSSGYAVHGTIEGAALAFGAGKVGPLVSRGATEASTWLNQGRYWRVGISNAGGFRYVAMRGEILDKVATWAFRASYGSPYEEFEIVRYHWYWWQVGRIGRGPMP